MEAEAEAEAEAETAKNGSRERSGRYIYEMEAPGRKL